MTYAAVLELLLKYGPAAVQMGAKLVEAYKAGKSQQQVSDADWAELTRLAGLDSAAIYARLGIELPPPASTGSTP